MDYWLQVKSGQYKLNEQTLINQGSNQIKVLKRCKIGEISKAVRNDFPHFMRRQCL